MVNVSFGFANVRFMRRLGRLGQVLVVEEFSSSTYRFLFILQEEQRLICQLTSLLVCVVSCGFY